MLHLSQATDDVTSAIKTSLSLISSKEAEISSISEQVAAVESKLAEAGSINKKLQDQFDRIDEQDMPPEQLQTVSMLQKQIESLEDQVFDRDAALQEIESQMKQDYEQHDQLIGKLKSQVCAYGHVHIYMCMQYINMYIHVYCIYMYVYIHVYPLH